MYFWIHFLQFNCINWWWSGWQLLELQTLPEISISSTRREKRNHLGRSEVYFSATVDLVKARRCFDKEPRYVLRRTHKTLPGRATLSLWDLQVTRCSSPIEPHFLKGGLLFNRWGAQFYWRGAPFLGSAAVLQERRSVFRGVRIFVSPRLSNMQVLKTP